MIFVTVGTHEQGFDRLVKEIDVLKKENIIKEDVFIQLGYTEYIPENCEYKKMIGFQEMRKRVEESRIVITHGGPGSIMLPWEFNKIPIVVPRNPEFDEHVDNHQILFAKRLEADKKIIAIYDIEDLKEKIVQYDKISEKANVKFTNNTKKFNDAIKAIVERLKEDGDRNESSY